MLKKKFLSIDSILHSTNSTNHHTIIVFKFMVLEFVGKVKKSWSA